MEPLSVRLYEEPGNEPCAMCGAVQESRKGPRMILGDQAVCRECGRRQDPRLSALVELAATADRVGKSFRHLLTPPLEAMLELAKAAENYCQSGSGPTIRPKAS